MGCPWVLQAEQAECVHCPWPGRTKWPLLVQTEFVCSPWGFQRKYLATYFGIIFLSLLLFLQSFMFFQKQLFQGFETLHAVSTHNNRLQVNKYLGKTCVELPEMAGTLIRNFCNYVLQLGTKQEWCCRHVRLKFPLSLMGE